MLKWILILLVPGIILFSDFSDNEGSPKDSLVPVQVQNTVPETQKLNTNTPIQIEQKAETVEVAPKPATTSITVCGRLL